MSGRALSRCGVVPELLSALAARGVCSAAQLLAHSALELSQELDVAPPEAEELLRRVSAAVCPPALTAADLCGRGLRGLPTGLPPLDAVLRGGVPSGAITELVGPAGAGKTQMCMQLAAQAVLQQLLARRAATLNQAACPPAHGGPVRDGEWEGKSEDMPSVVYIDTENKFHSHRLAEIAAGQLRAAGVSDPTEVAAAVRNCQERVILMPVTELEDMVQRSKTLEFPCIDHGAGLVIVDSIANLIRTCPLGDMLAGQAALAQVAASMKKLAEALKFPVVMTNQVATRFGPAASHQVTTWEAVGPEAGGSSELGAALGTAWAHAVNTRLVLEAGAAGSRTLRVAKSPTAPCIAIPFRIAAAGVEVDGTMDGMQRGGAKCGRGSCMDVRIANEVDYMPGG